VKNSTLNEIHKAGIEQLQQTENYLRGVLAQFNIVYFDEAIPSLMSRLKAKYNNKFNRVQALEDLEVIRRILQDNPIQRSRPKAASPTLDQLTGTVSENLPVSINQSEPITQPVSPVYDQPIKRRRVQRDPDVEPSDSETDEMDPPIPNTQDIIEFTKYLDDVIIEGGNGQQSQGAGEEKILEGSGIEQPIQSESINQVRTIKQAETSEQSINQSRKIELAEWDEETDKELSRSQPGVDLPAHSSERLSISQPVLSSNGMAIYRPDQGFIKVHRERPKSDWRVRLKESTQFLLITDDNIKLHGEIPANWEAHIFQEAHLSNITNVINNLKVTNRLGALLLAVGWYDRERAESNMRKEVNALAFACNKLKVEIRFFGITGRQDKPIPPGVGQLNTIAKLKFGEDYWEPVVEKYVFAAAVPCLSTYVNYISDLLDE
jgi:hypothetical protein